MAKVLLSFVSILLAAAGIAGLYLGALAVNLVWLFWFIVLLSALGAASRALGPRALQAFRQWRDYPSKVREIEELRGEVESLKSDQLSVGRDSSRAREEGVLEGRAQVIGAVLAASTVPPSVVAIAPHEGEVALVGTVVAGSLPIGARYMVTVSATGTRRGVVRVAAFDATRDVYFLTCVDPTTPAFWSALRDRLDVDTSPPNGIQLDPFVIRSDSPETRSSAEDMTQEVQE